MVAISKAETEEAGPKSEGSPVSSDRPRVTRIGHSTVLFDFGEEKILTDPWFSEKFGYNRGEPLAMSVQNLPRLSAVLVSHSHYDHFDVKAFSQYADHGVLFVVMRGTEAAATLRSHGFSNVRELLPWETVEVGQVRVTAVPGRHGVPEITFVLEGQGTVTYFGGDTLWIPELKELASRFPRFDLALVPINGLTIRIAGNKRVVMTPEEAAQLVALLHPRVTVPIHYAFRGGWFMDHFILKYNGSVERFETAVRMAAPETQTRVIEPGEPLPL